MILKRLIATSSALAGMSVLSQAALTGWWAFDDLSDSSGNGHNVTLHGDASLGAGAFGGGLVLDGDGDWADVVSSVDHQFEQGTSFTLTVFFNGPDSDTNNGLVTKGYANNPRDPAGYYLLQVTNPNQVEFDSRCCAGGTPRFRTGQIGPDVTDGGWHNITIVRDQVAGEMRSYIDGNLEHSAALNATTGGDWNMGVNGEVLTFGDHLDRFTTGSLDDIAIWKGDALSGADVSFIAANGVAAYVPEPSTGLLAALAALTLLARRREQ